MSNIGGSKLAKVQDSRLVGEVIEAAVNPDPLKWMTMGGQELERAKYPELSKLFPVGTFTSTARTLAGAPSSSVIIADNTNFIAASSTATGAPMQTSADGITWNSPAAGWAASTTWGCMIVAGSRIVALPAAGETAAFVTATNQTAVATTLKSNWTATTGCGSSAVTQGLAYSPQLGLTVAIRGSTDALAYTLSDGSTAWTARTTPSSAKTAICWTGTRFIITEVTVLNQALPIIVSTDGINWSREYLPFVGGTGHSPSIVSDGNGTVVCSGYINTGVGGGNTGATFTSKDGGATWVSVFGAADAYALNIYMSYVNGLFIGAYGYTTVASTGISTSTDGLNWFNEPSSARAGLTMDATYYAYKSGVYCGIIASITSALTATLGTTKFRLPASNIRTTGLMPRFIKYRS